jgi:hypothetical protein
MTQQHAPVLTDAVITDALARVLARINSQETK